MDRDGMAMPSSHPGPTLEYQPVGLTDPEATCFEGNDTLVTMVQVPTSELMEIPRRLVDQCALQLGRYGGTPSKDRLLALSVNPWMATAGIVELELMSEEIKKCRLQTLRNLGTDHKSQAMDVLEAKIKEICSEKLKSNEHADSESDEDRPHGKQSESKAERRRKLLQKRSKAIGVSSLTPEDSCPVRQEIINFFNQSFNPQAVLSTQTRKPVTKEDLEKIGTNALEWPDNFELIAKNFDVMEWWENHGKQIYPLIYPIACLILALPDSNGMQERTFSSGTWMDGKLKKQQKDETFRMKVLLYKNKKFLEEHRLDVMDDKK
jgi:hAT family C-terminal dimerisation region